MYLRCYCFVGAGGSWWRVCVCVCVCVRARACILLPLKARIVSVPRSGT